MIEMKNFNELYNKVISEARISLSSIKSVSRGVPNIEQVKEELLKLFKFNSWNEFIDFQKTGQCDYIAKVVCKLFPKFKMVSVYVDISPDAKKKMGPGYTYAIHYLNKLNDTYYDFAKGANCYDGVYILDGLGNKYDVNVTLAESSQFSKEMIEDPKSIGTNLR